MGTLFGVGGIASIRAIGFETGMKTATEASVAVRETGGAIVSASCEGLPGPECRSPTAKELPVLESPRAQQQNQESKD